VNGADRVVPVGMEIMTLDVQSVELMVGDFDAVGIGVGVELATQFKAGLRRGRGDQLDNAWWVTSGLPCQFMVMNTIPVRRS